jgi:uncharacterized membrane protein YgdD (TMEM256/DUF423 family)
MLAVFETGARGQMYHALAIIAVGLILGRMITGWCALPAGCSQSDVLFSGSRYARADGREDVRPSPLGGLAFLIGWHPSRWRR